MGKGLIEALASMQKQATNNEYIRRLSLKDGESAIVRFLESSEDMRFANVYQLPPRGNQKYGQFVPTLDVDGDGSVCPFRDNLEQTPRVRIFMNMIWRDAPKTSKTDSGRWEVVGKEDAVVLWEQGAKTLQSLLVLDKDFGLTSRDFRITRTGSGTQTNYIITPAADASEMSDSDKKLKDEAYDLNKFVTPPSRDEALKMLGITKQSFEEEAYAKSDDDNLFL